MTLVTGDVNLTHFNRFWVLSRHSETDDRPTDGLPASSWCATVCAHIEGMLLLPGGGAAAYLPRPAPRRDRAPRCCCADQPPADAGAGSADASLGELLAACGAASAAAASARAAAAAAELAAARAQRALSSALAEPSPAPRTGAAPAADAPGVTARRRACLALRHTRAPNRVLPQRIVIVRHGESEARSSPGDGRPPAAAWLPAASLSRPQQLNPCRGLAERSRLPGTFPPLSPLCSRLSLTRSHTQRLRATWTRAATGARPTRRSR